MSSSLLPENIGPQITSIHPLLPKAKSIREQFDVTIGPLLRLRVIRPEILDESPAHEAEQSLADLVRINRVFGGHAVLLRTLRQLFPAGAMFSLLDVGAASGDMGAAVRKVYPNASVTSLDYKLTHLRRAAGPKVAGDAFALPFRRAAFGIVHCSLFLHHFPDSQVVDLLREFSRVARQHVVVTDLERHVLPYWTLPATRWIFGWHPITLHDGPISVAAGFHQEELQRLGEAAGLEDVRVRRYRPSFRLALTGAPARS
jgi:ubiquinone/menaquinone biosynthesis C-methylase UbiE